MVLGVLALFLMAFAAAPTASSAGDNYFLVKMGGFVPRASDVEIFDTGFAGEIVIGKYFSIVGVELEGGYYESKDGPSKLTVYPVALNGRLRLPIPFLKPYVLGGAGAYFTKLDTGTALGTDDDTAFGLQAGVGVDFKLWILLMNIEAKYLWAQPKLFGSDVNIDGITATVGVGLEF
jgi:opacity protein-like surface antigen